jgi:subtilisin-like proprotein convertase family protein
MKKITGLLLLCLLATNASAQRTNLFQPIQTSEIEHSTHLTRGVSPQKYDTYRLDYTGIQAALESAPWEFTHEARQRKCLITMPIADGATEEFSVWRTAMLDDELAAAFPYVRTYAGISTQGTGHTVRFSVTLRGFRAMVLRPDFGVRYIQPYAWGQTDYYIAYDRADLPREGKKLGKLTASDLGYAGSEPQRLFAPAAESRGTALDPIQMKVYRLCVAATGEFSQDHGGTKPLVFSALTEYVNFVSGIYERDATLRTQLTAASQNVIFLDPATDPYPGTSVPVWVGVNPQVLQTYANNNSFDIGHVFGRFFFNGILGQGSLGSVCGANKAAGGSAGYGAGDYGDDFISVIGQEISHQFGANHTWSKCQDIGGYVGVTAFEPGSGSTIMSYAGACGSDNIQVYSDLYYHGGSIQEIRDFYLFGPDCGSSLTTTNTPPTVALPYGNNFNIPISTPFELVGSAQDLDSEDVLTYCWEQLDAGPQVPLGEPIGNAALFRTLPAVSASNRYFPRLNTVLNNQTDIKELLPTYTRDLTFRLTVRDNRPDGGGVGWADVEFKAFAGAGPFRVSAPNAAGAVWRVGEYANVTWDVANTQLAPVNCQAVNIRLSTDGGLTYPITLASGVVNDGSQYVLVPNQLTSTARIRVDAADNIFYDVSNANFSIQQPNQPALTLGLATDATTICLPSDFSTEILSAGLLGFDTPISLEVVGDLPPGVTAAFSTNPIMPGQPSTLTLNLGNVDFDGTVSFAVQAVAGAETLLRPVTLLLRRNDFTGFLLQTPTDGSVEQPIAQTLRWSKGLDADTYDVQLSKTPAFSTLVASKLATPLDSFKISFALEKGTAYFWRVRPSNECGAHDWSAPFFFSTYAENCQTFEANDLPKNIPAGSASTVESVISLNGGGTVSDLNVSSLQGSHTFFKDLEAHLISPQGTDVLLWKDKCGNYNGNFNFALDDAAPGNFPCPPNANGQSYKAQNPLTPFIGENSMGAWKLRLKDNVIGSGGVLNAFKLEFCASVTLNPPFLVNNNPMPIPTGTSKLITPDFLLVEDANNSHAQIIFTLLTVPPHGILYKEPLGIMQPGDQFSQADLDAGNIRLYDYGTSGEAYGFRFMATDNEGGFFGTPLFLAQPLGLSAEEPSARGLDFALFPNPAHDAVWVDLGAPAASSVRVSLFGLNGQLLQTAEIPAGAERLQIVLRDFPKGMYAVRLESATAVGARKLVLR